MKDKQSGDEFKLANIVGQGDASAIAFGDENQLWVVENSDRTNSYDLASGTSGERNAPSGTWIEMTYRYGVAPLYKIFPKPGEFYKVVTHLSSSGDTETNLDVDLRQQPIELANPWLPLWSGMGFMFIMLTIACGIFHFKDF